MNIHEYEDKKSSQRNTKWQFQEGAIYSLFGISISHVLPIKYHMTYLKSSQPPFEGSLYFSLCKWSHYHIYESYANETTWELK